MAYPQISGTQLSSRASGGSVDSVLLPASIAAGDLVLVFHASDGSTTRSFPSPWVEVVDATAYNNTASIGIGYLIASGGEGTVDVTKNIEERFTAVAIKIGAATWDGVAPVEINTPGTASSTVISCGTLTPTWGALDTLWIAALLMDDSAGTNTVASYPLADNNIKMTAVLSAAGGAICTDEINNSSFYPGVYEISPSDEMWAATLGVKPAAAGGLTGSTTWGHTTAVVETNVRTFSGNWTGTGQVEGSGDSERLSLNTAEYMISEVVNMGAGSTVQILQNNYASGSTTTLEYRQGSTSAECGTAAFASYSGTFTCAGYVQIRVTSTL